MSIGNEQPPSFGTPSDDDIFETLSIGDTSSRQDQGSQTPAEPAAAAPVAPEAGAAVSAPAAPDTPPAGNEAPPEPAAPTQPKETPPAPAAPASAEPPAPAPQPATPPSGLDAEEQLRRASQEAIIDALQRENERLRASPPAGQPVPTGQPEVAPESGAAPAETPFRYTLTLPEATRNALLSEDPAQNVAAINAIVNDLGTIVHHTVVSQLRTEMRNAFGQLNSLANQTQTATTQSQAREQARDSYYKVFPGHKNPLIEPIIRQQAIALSTEHPGAAFNDQYIAALGARVNTALEQLGAKPPEQPVGNPASGGNTPPPKPAAHLPSGVRGGGTQPSVTGELSEDIMGTLDPFSAG